MHKPRDQNVDIAHFLGGSVISRPSTNSSITLICPVSNETSVKWFYNGTEIDNMNSNQLRKIKLEPGTYSCTFVDPENGVFRNISSQLIIDNNNPLFGLIHSSVFDWKIVNQSSINGSSIGSVPQHGVKFDVENVESSFFVSNQCLGNRKCFKVDENCQIGCALRRNKVISLTNYEDCHHIKEAQVPYSKMCSSPLDPRWTMENVGNVS